MTKYEEIYDRYSSGGIRDEQLDGTGAQEGSVYITRNYVALGVITQNQADDIRNGNTPVNPDAEDMLQAINIYEGADE